MDLELKHWKEKFQKEKLAREEAERLLEEQLMQIEKEHCQLKKVQEISKLGSWKLDINSHLLEWSDETYKIFEIHKDKYHPLLLKDFLGVIYQEDAWPFFEAYNDKHLANHEVYSFVHRIVTKEGKIKYVQERGKTIYDEEDNPIATYGTVQDITEQITLKKKIDRSEQIIQERSKMAELGSMIGNIAHQWKQPLNVINMIANTMRFESEFEELHADKVKEYAQDIENKVQYLSDTINTFRNFLLEKKSLEIVDINERIDLAINIVELALKDNNIKLIKSIQSDEELKITIPLGELVEVLINIINNAKDILIENEIEEPWIKIQLDKVGNSALIMIEDNAGGVPLEIMPRIFEEYFTTKGLDKGTGLGLHMSKRIIEESLGGKLYVENTQHGAKFFIEIPLNS